MVRRRTAQPYEMSRNEIEIDVEPDSTLENVRGKIHDVTGISTELMEKFICEERDGDQRSLET